MRDEPLLPPFCATSARSQAKRSQAKRRTPKYTYENFKMENEFFFNSHAKMRNMYNNILTSSNSFDVFDVNGATDVMGVTDVMDVTDVMGVTDVMDVTDVTDVMDVPDVMDLPDDPDAPHAPDTPDVPDDDVKGSCSARCSERRGGSASTCRHEEELAQRGDECTWPSVESNPERTYAQPLREEESASLLRHTSRYSSLCLYSTNQTVHGTCYNREHTKCSIQKRKTFAKCRMLKMDGRYTNYYARVQGKKRNRVCLKRKKKKTVRGGALTGEMNKRDITLFEDHPLEDVGKFEKVSSSIHAYPRGRSAHMVFHPEEAHLERVLPSEDTLDKPNRDKYLAYISHSIIRQGRKVSCFEKNADRMLDLVELVLYNRMKEAFFLKERICDKDRYKELCPEVFFFDNDDDLIETMDRNCRFLPKVPAKENLTTYRGPSPSSIFGEHYSTYKYFFKLVKVDIKLYRWPDPYDAVNTVQNKRLKKLSCSDLLYSYKTGVNYPCGNDIRRATKVDNAGETKKKKKEKKKYLLPFLQSAPTREDNEEMQHTEYISVNRIPPDLIQLLKYRNVTLG
ncbi:hypothetical protein PCYB_074220 [Plasmodium cynomolgi strain B]|uniref:Uncharacterized protein n=1 Tax=Plasmodium cynomolgi (strain B) TaxID=1120755 RepID=K6UD37_PLACD|nr:hypothetical protein PCYB_074220 [Plasmodium cynomolgi strain B]GAB65921.1 hypothetical protein PCYB_074220 [Plasmodium cynomolgi strain B]